MITLTRAKPDSIRGLPRHWGELNVGPRGLIICGENGTGKTSVLDALEYAIKGASTLFGTNRIGVSWESAAPHIKTGAPDVLIDLTDGVHTYSVSSVSEGNRFPQDVTRWLEIARKSNFIFRRYMLLDFVDTAPASRYAALEPFLAMDSYADIEQALSQWLGNLDTQIDSIDSELSSIKERISSVFRLEKNNAALSINEAISYLNTKLAEVGLSACKGMDYLEECEGQINLNLGGQTVTKRVEELVDLKGQASRLGLPNSLSQMLKALIDAQKNFDTLVSQARRLVFADFLVEAHNLISKHTLSVCPVCEKPFDRLQILTRLKQRIETDKRIMMANSIVKARRTALTNPTTIMLSDYRTFANVWKRILPSTPLPAAYTGALSFLEALKQVLSQDKTTGEELCKCYGLIEKSVTDHKPVLQALGRAIVKEGGGGKRAALINALQIIDTIRKDVVKHQSLVICRIQTVKRRNVLGRLYQHTVDARKYAVQETFDAVADLANAMYERLHPDEGIAKSTLSIREAARASVILTTDFYGQSENPLLHHSESHLDTLGLCYFLALRRRAADQESAFKLLVLDDVIYSVDAIHRSRLTGILNDYFADHQIVLTTHDPVFFQRLREKLGGKNIEYRRFVGWDIERGPLSADSKFDTDRVCSKEVRNSKSPDELAGACGRFFEMFLRHIAESLKVSVIAKFEGRYEINDLWPPVKAKLTKNKGFLSANSKTIAKIDDNRWVRNECGAHYNEAPIPPTPSEIRDLAEGLAELYAATHCEVCGDYISRQANGDWRCACTNSGLVYPS